MYECMLKLIHCPYHVIHLNHPLPSFQTNLLHLPIHSSSPSPSSYRHWISFSPLSFFRLTFIHRHPPSTFNFPYSHFFLYPSPHHHIVALFPQTSLGSTQSLSWSLPSPSSTSHPLTYSPLFHPLHNIMFLFSLRNWFTSLISILYSPPSSLFQCFPSLHTSLPLHPFLYSPHRRSMRGAGSLGIAITPNGAVHSWTGRENAMIVTIIKIIITMVIIVIIMVIIADE